MGNVALPVARLRGDGDAVAPRTRRRQGLGAHARERQPVPDLDLATSVGDGDAEADDVRVVAARTQDVAVERRSSVLGSGSGFNTVVIDLLLESQTCPNFKKCCKLALNYNSD